MVWGLGFRVFCRTIACILDLALVDAQHLRWLEREMRGPPISVRSLVPSIPILI